MIRNRTELTDHGNGAARSDALAIAEAGIERVHPRRAVPAALERDGTLLRVDDRTFDLGAARDVFLVGAGKGSGAVARELETVLGDALDGGVVAEKAGQIPSLDRVTVLGTGHPEPDAASREAGRRVLEVADAAGEDDVVFACITGGASAQLVAPAGDLTLSDVRETTGTLLRSGLPIDEINAVRKHLSRLKGGKLALRAAPATVVTLVVVDEVAGEPWGPTVPDETTFADALAVVEGHGLESDVPRAVLDHLRRGAENPALETPDSTAFERLPAFATVIADATDACEAARDEAEHRGYAPLILSTSIEGESREVATALAGIAEEARAFGRPAEPPCVLISGGETTVTVADEPGEGGPNQEFALRFAMEIADTDRITTLSLGTDGTDGPTDIAGGLVDGSTLPRLDERGGDARDALRRNDAATPLRQVDDAVYTGPTGTNVMDLRLTIVQE